MQISRFIPVHREHRLFWLAVASGFLRADFGLTALIIAFTLAVISYTISTAMIKAPADAKPASLEEFDFPQVEEDTPQPVIFGDVWMEGWNVLWYGNLRTTEVKGEDTGKK